MCFGRYLKYRPCKPDRQAQSLRSPLRNLSRYLRSVHWPNVRLEAWCFLGRKGMHFSADRYGACVRAACRAAGVGVFSPNQLRHSQATAIRAKYGAEAARVVLGHSNLSTTEIYALADLEQARRIAEALG